MMGSGTESRSTSDVRTPFGNVDFIDISTQSFLTRAFNAGEASEWPDCWATRELTLSNAVRQGARKGPPQNDESKRSLRDKDRKTLLPAPQDPESKRCDHEGETLDIETDEHAVISVAILDGSVAVPRD
jgi:hypothetical protein